MAMNETAKPARPGPGAGSGRRSRAKARRNTDSELDFGDMKDHLGYRLRRAQLASFQDFKASFAALDMRPTQYSVMALIHYNPGRKQSEIAAALGIKRSNFVSLMDELERRKLAERRKAEGDRRSHALFLTPEGERMMKKLERAHRRHQAHLIARIGAENSELLLGLLRRISGSEIPEDDGSDE